ncbi:MAG: hypothetical protein AAFX93_07345 [Verrucomicrobiota bacterium]
MSFNLNELRAQRDRIREHLAWLDQKIAEAEGKNEQGSPKNEAPPNAPEPNPGTEPAESPANAGVATTPATPALSQDNPSNVTPANSATDEAAATTVDKFLPKEPGGFDGSSKFGCILAAAAVGGVILFLIFGLPELLY